MEVNLDVPVALERLGRAKPVVCKGRELGLGELVGVQTRGVEVLVLRVVSVIEISSDSTQTTNYHRPFRTDGSDQESGPSQSSSAARASHPAEPP